MLAPRDLSDRVVCLRPFGDADPGAVVSACKDPEIPRRRFMSTLARDQLDALGDADPSARTS